MLQSVTSWKGLTNTHEIGLFIENWPNESHTSWTLNDPEDKLMSGVTQLLQAQTYVNERLASPEPTEGLAELGQAAIVQAYQQEEEKPKKGGSQQTQSEGVMAGVPASGLNSELSSAKQHYAVSKGKANLLIPQKKRKAENAASETETQDDAQESTAATLSNLKPKRRRKNTVVAVDVSEDSLLGKTRIVGTTSAKLSYLVDRILALHREEKILVFYDGENTA